MSINKPFHYFEHNFSYPPILWNIFQAQGERERIFIGMRSNLDTSEELLMAATSIWTNLALRKSGSSYLLNPNGKVAGVTGELEVYPLTCRRFPINCGDGLFINDNFGRTSLAVQVYWLDNYAGQILTKMFRSLYIRKSDFIVGVGILSPPLSRRSFIVPDVFVGQLFY